MSGPFAVSVVGSLLAVQRPRDSNWFSAVQLSQSGRCPAGEEFDSTIIAHMGTMIILALNGVPVDYGKNHYWTSHASLFPPGSDKNVPYVYADNVVEIRPGLAAALDVVGHDVVVTNRG